MSTSEHSADLGPALQAVAVLLHYPGQEAQEHAGTIGELLGGRPELSVADRDGLEALCQRLRDVDLLQQEADYVETFDHSNKVSLHLFEHIHGESRDRGPAMVELRMAYREQGLELDANELPDYLPLFLEFCAQLPETEARDWLSDISHVLQRIHVRLYQRDNRYALPVRLLLRLAGEEPWPADLMEEAQGEQRDDTREAIDSAWREAPVTFEAGSALAGCGAAGAGQGNPAGQGSGHV
jgi:nitrate reductase delta subunit